LQGLFRNLNDHLMPVFKRVLGQLVQSDKEGQQRFAAEIVAGMVRGSRLWSYDKLTTMWAWLFPLLTSALENITNETSANWATCINMIFCTRDPRRVHWLVELLFSLNEKLTESSFHRAM
jgi:proteasome activator subunit 4